MTEGDYATKSDLQATKADLLTEIANLELRLLREMNLRDWRRIAFMAGVAGIAVTVTRLI